MTSTANNPRITVLAGGGGGARLAHGFDRCAQDVTIIVNTGDDAQIYGVAISPDVDTVLYTLSERLDTGKGWGLAEETFATLDALEALGRDTWFTVGDKDFATHLMRTQLLAEGEPLSLVTRRLCAAMGVRSRVLPMSDERVSTLVDTDAATLSFQEYFVRRGHRDTVKHISFDGVDDARPAPSVLQSVTACDLLVFGPSNPFVSIGPILAVPGINRAVANCDAVRVAVSPIMGGAVVKGPAADMLASLGHEVSAVGVAKMYQGLVDVFVLDNKDAHLAASIGALGMEPVVTDTLLHTLADKDRLSRQLMGLL